MDFALSFKKLFFPTLLILLCHFSSVGQHRNQIIDYKTKITIENGRKTEEHSFLIQIDDAESDWIAEVKIPYSGNNKPDIKEAYIMDAKGRVVRELKKKEIINRSNISSGSFYEDDYIQEFELKWNTYPYRIKYTYSISLNDFIHVVGWSPLPRSRVPTKHASLEVNMPKNYEARIFLSGGFKYDSISNFLNTTYKWEISDVKPVKDELYSPPYYSLLPVVVIVPEEFRYGEKGSFKTWASYGTWIEKLNEGKDELPEYEQSKVDKMIHGMTNKKEIIRTLYHYLQDNTRYINIAIEIGGLQSYPASYVCENKYGDCKALTMYMKALLKHAGIPSYYTLINAGSNIEKIESSLPSQQFNHVILCVPVEGDTLWLENTSNSSPYNYLGTFTQDRLGLVVNEDKSKLVRTPFLSNQDVLQSSSYQFELDGNGHGQVKIVKTIRGEWFENYSYVKKELSDDDRLQVIKKTIPVRNSKITDWSLIQSDRDQKAIKLEIDLNVESQFRKIGNMLTIQPIFDNNLKFSPPKSRSNPVQINFPINKTDSVTYDLPFANNYTIQLPENESIETPYGSYEISYEVHDNKISYIQSFVLNKGYYSLEQYPDFYAFIEKIKTYRHSSIIILTPN